MKKYLLVIISQLIQIQLILGLGVISKNNETINNYKKSSGKIVRNKIPGFQLNENSKYPLKRVIIVLGNCNDSLMSVAAGNELYNLLGHFNTKINIIKKYKL